MEIFTKAEFENLASTHANHSVSIYSPTHRSNENGDAIQRDKIEFKNQIKEATKQLEAHGMKPQQADTYLEPLTELLENTDFWNYNSDGIAIFYAGEEVKIYRLPSHFEPFAYVGSHYYLKPLSVLLKDPGRHFILRLNLGSVALFEATENSIVRIDTGGDIPQDMRESVGYDFEEKQLQQRTGQGERGEADGIYHGHGKSNESVKKEEALKFFRDVNEGVMKYIHKEEAPLIVACVDYLFPIYREANTYPYLHDSHVSGNFEDRDSLRLKEKAWEHIREERDARRSREKQNFEAQMNEGRSSFEADKAIPASIAGRTEVLFLRRDDNLWGVYEERSHDIRTSEVRSVGESDLFDLAATHTILNGGKVYLLEKDEMPEPESSINAIFRYEG
jgi:hypothetical protein